MSFGGKVARRFITLGVALAANETVRAIAVGAVLAATRGATRRTPAALASAKPPALKPEDALYTLVEVASELRVAEPTLRRFLPTVRGLTKFRIGRRMLLDARGVALIRAAMEVPSRVPGSGVPRAAHTSQQGEKPSKGVVLELAAKRGARSGHRNA